jgi:hypothetical protein
MHFDLPVIERTIAVMGGIVVALVSAKALKDDWHTPGVDNNVFKLMLGLLCLGAVIALLAGVGVLGNFPKVA